MDLRKRNADKLAKLLEPYIAAARGDGLDVQVKAVGEGVQVRHVRGADGDDPLPEEAAVLGLRGQQGGEGADEAGHGGHLRAGGGQGGEGLVLAGGQVGGPGEQEPGRPAG